MFYWPFDRSMPYELLMSFQSNISNTRKCVSSTSINLTGDRLPIIRNAVSVESKRNAILLVVPPEKLSATKKLYNSRNELCQYLIQRISWSKWLIGKGHRSIATHSWMVHHMTPSKNSLGVILLPQHEVTMHYSPLPSPPPLWMGC